MAYPSYYEPIIQDAMSMAGMTPGSASAFVDGYRNVSQATPMSPNSGFSFANPKPVGRSEQLNAQRVSNLNAYESQRDAIAPFFQKAHQMASIRNKEDLRKYQRDYRRSLYGPSMGTPQYISGTGDRMAGVSATGDTRSTTMANLSDPVTQSFMNLSRPVF